MLEEAVTIVQLQSNLKAFVAHVLRVRTMRLIKITVQ
jgi:hypothetical protein